MNFSAVILAAGKGTRMNSELPKVVHKIAGYPIIQHVIDAVRNAGSEEIILVLGFGREIVCQMLDNKEDLHIAVQEQQLGTGHALMQAEKALSKASTILVTNGDMPLLRSQTLADLLKFHWESGAEATIMTAILDNPFGYGRVIRRKGGFFDRIVEEKDANNEEKKIQEVNSGTYCFQTNSVFRALQELKNNNSQHEYYLPDVLKILRRWRLPISVYAAGGTQEEIKGVNDHIQQAEAEHILRQRKNHQLMLEGVTIIDPETTYIDWPVTIGQDTIILPGSFLCGNTHIGKNCIIGPYSFLSDSTIEQNCTIQQSWLQKVQVKDHCQIGPFANLRAQTFLEPKTRVGSFVEIKNSQIGYESALPHLSYIGDSQIGSHVNIGAGSITCNFNGKGKQKTVIGDHAFIGSNVNLIAPIHVGENSCIGAGSTLSENIPEDSLAVERARAHVVAKRKSCCDK